MAITVAEIVAKIRSEGVDRFVSDMRQGEKATEQATGKMSKFGKSVGGIGRSLTGSAALSAASFVGITGPVLGFFGKTIDSASDLNESTSAVKTVFGDAAKTVLDFAAGSAKAVGQSRNAVLQTSGALGALYTNLGITQKQAAGFTNQMVTAAADLGSFYNEDPTAMLERLRAALVGEYDPIQRYGFAINAAAVEQRALADTGKATAAELTEGEKVLARQAILFEQMGAAAGDFGRTSGGLANQTRILKSQLSDLSANLGQTLLPIALKATTFFNNLLTKLTGLSPTGQKIVVVIGLIAAAIGPLLIVMSTLIGAIGTVTAAFGAGGMLASITPLLGPIGLIVAAIVGLGVAYKTNFLGFADAVDYVAGKVMSALRPVVKFFSTMIETFRDVREQGFDPVSAALYGLANALRGIGGDNTPKWIVTISTKLFAAGKAVRQFIELIRKLGSGDTVRVHKLLNALPTPLAKLALVFARVQQGITRFTDAWKKAGALAAFRTLPQSIELFGRSLANLITSVTGFERFGSRLKEVFEGIGNVVGDVVELVNDLVHGRWSEALDDLGSLAGHAVDLFIDQFLLLPTLLFEVFEAIDWGRVGSILLSGLGIAGQGLLDGIRALGGVIVDTFSSIDWGNVGDLLVKGLGIALDALKSAGSRLAGFIGDSFRAINWGAVAATLGDLGGWLLDKGGELLGGFLDGAEDLWRNDVFPWLRDIGSRALSHIPELGLYLFDKGWKLIEGAWKGISGLWERIAKPFFEKIGSKALGFVPELGGYLWDKGWDLLEGAWKGITAIWDTAVQPFFEKIGSRVLDSIPLLSGLLVGKGKALFGGLREGVRQVWEPFSEFLGGIADTISGLVDLETIRKILEPIAKFFEETAGRILGAIADIAGAVGGKIGLGGDSEDKPSQDGKPAPSGDGTGSVPNVQVIQPVVDMSEFSKAFQLAADDVRKVFEILRVDVVNKLKQTQRNTTTEAENIRAKIANEFIGLNNDSRTLMSKLDKIITGTWLDTIPTTKRKVEELRTAVKTVLINMHIDAAKTVENMKNNVVNLFVGMRNDAQTLAVSLNTKVLTEIRSMRDQGTRSTETMRTSIANTFVGLRNDADTIARDLRKKVSDHFAGIQTDTGGEGRASFGVLRANITASLRRLRDDAGTIAFELRNRVVNELVGMRNDAASVLSGLASKVRSALQDAVSAGYDESSAFLYVGQNIGAGLINGVAGTGTALANTVRRIIRDALAAGNDEAATASPSRKTTWTGSMMGEGYIVGMLAKLQGIRRASQTAVDEALRPWQSARPEANIGLVRGAYNGSYVPSLSRVESSAPTVAPVFVVMTRSELLAFFAAVDVVQVLTDPAEVSAALGGA